MPRDGIEPPTRGFSILDYSSRFLGVSRKRPVGRSKIEATKGSRHQPGCALDPFHRGPCLVWPRPAGFVALALAAVALAGCLGGEVRVDGAERTPLATYPVEVDEACASGALEARAVASCEPGDRVLAGGCAWGAVVDPHDQPLRPLVDRPSLDGDGWECIGQNTGVGETLKTITATALCAAEEG